MIIEKKIAETERELKESGIKEKIENERRAIDSMQEYPKMFYTYVNNQKNRRREIGPLKNSKGELVYDGVEICNTLKDEYTKEFSERDGSGCGRLFDEHISEDLCDIEIRRKGIENAIDELQESSSAGPDGIPVILVKKTKEVISLPLAIILRKSLDSGEIPDIFKMAYITQYKKVGREKAQKDIDQ